MMEDHLGRLVAAERNALAAIELARSASAALAAVRTESEKLVRLSVQQQEQIQQLQVRLALMRGTGPTGG